MTVRTNINTSHLVRLGLIGLFCGGFALACLYDGFVRYPNQRIRAEAFDEFKEEHSELDPKDIVDNWKEYAVEQGWPANDRGKPRTNYEINGQFVMATALAPVGLFFLTQLLLNRGRWIEAHDMTLTSSRGQQFELSQIIELNKKKWDKKGIATIKYESDGRKRKLVLDDCNYQRDTTNAILRHIETNIDHAKIVGGKPEPPLKNKPPEGDHSQCNDHA
ncbi:MAG: hypothetical protein GXP28_09665 [Planctomycetes bacterium]|nr:hypothetical protein [Planctomycetota bacterium]